ncbi:MAG: hydantoinase/oxoprolinase family protein [Acidobacteriota bacterium]
MREFIGWDIGGVHLKAARLTFRDGRLVPAQEAARYFEMWRGRERLAQAMRELRRELGGEEVTHALTMTAELADCFASKSEGVAAVLCAAREALGGEALRVWSCEGSFASEREAIAEPLAFAGSNWLATAVVASRCVESGLLIDIGSTTTDLVLLAGGRPQPHCRNDTGRLTCGELVYTGVLRAPPATLAAEVPLGGDWCRLSPEAFAFTADVYLVLGRLVPEQITTPTADGGPPTPEAAQRRLARLVCADLESLGREPVLGMARFLESAQIALLERALRQVLSRAERGTKPMLVATGLGRFLAMRLAQRLEIPCQDLSDLVPVQNPQAAPAVCVALLLAGEALGICGPEAWKPKT